MPFKRKLRKSESPFSSPVNKRFRAGRPGQSDHTEVGEKILDVLGNYQDENGRVLADLFLKVPSKRQNPEYYEAIQDPIDLHRINQRLRLGEYKNIEKLTNDIELMIENTKIYYPPDSTEVKDADALWQLYINSKTNFMTDFATDDPENEANRANFSAMFHEIYNSIITAIDDTGRVISTMFMHLPSKQSFPEYYLSIKDPIDLTTIYQRIESESYISVQDFEADINLLRRNAETFNEPNSQIYVDAGEISKLFYSKLEELEKLDKPNNLKSSARLRRKRKSVPNLDESIASSSLQESPIRISRKAMQSPAAIQNCHKSNHKGLFYNDVVNYKNALGQMLSTAFTRLPNRHHYPRYYELVDNTMSCKKIRQAIITGKYESVAELTADMEQWMNNSIIFEEEHDEQLCKDAKELLDYIRERSPYYIDLEKRQIEMESDEEEEEENDESESEEESEIKKRKRRSNVSKTPVKAIKKVKLPSDIDIFNERLKMYYELMINAIADDGHSMIELFMEKPSRKDYPDYYKLILEPIDMRMINKKIRTDKYNSLEELLDDFNLMFNNARHYNETGSGVYKDADSLQKILFGKHEELGTLPPLAGDRKQSQGVEVNPLTQKLEQIFQNVRDYKDPTNRYICQLFTTLPSKYELPDYYQIIKKPMDMDRIMQKIQSNYYQSVDELMNDFLLMYENACTYNEPGSVIYKDALILQKHTLETCYQIKGTSNDKQIHKLVHELLNTLFKSVMEHKDENGRKYSESLQLNPADTVATKQDTEGQLEPGEIPMDQASLTNVQPVAQPQPLITLDEITNNILCGRYRRLDVFQEQMFDLFEAVRGSNRTDSVSYEDVVELQRYFIEKRDLLCKNGEIMMSPALAYTQRHLNSDIDEEKKEKVPLEKQEDELEKPEDIKDDAINKNSSQEMNFQGMKYEPGDFVYVENLDSSNGDMHIVCIERLYMDNDEQRLYGNWFYRPAETFHLPSKRFLEKEIFKSDYYNTVPVSKIRGKCYIMFSKDYFKTKPVGFEYDDTYICLNRYQSKTKTFKPIKILQLPRNRTELEKRDTPILPVYVASIYANDKEDEKPATEANHLGDWWPDDYIKKNREDIQNEIQTAEGTRSYTQICIGEKAIKQADCFYIKPTAVSFKPKIIRVENILKDAVNNVWLQGSYFICPDQTKHEPSKVFYRNEVFLYVPANVGADTQPVNIAPIPVDWLGDRCCVMSLTDALQCRPTEIHENHIFICQAKYVVADSAIAKKKWNLKTFPNRAIEDEVLYVKDNFELVREVSPLLLTIVKQELLDRENGDDDVKLPQQEPGQTYPMPGHPHQQQMVPQQHAEMYQNINGQIVQYQPQYNQQGYVVQQYPQQYQQQQVYAGYNSNVVVQQPQQQLYQQPHTPSPHAYASSPRPDRIGTPSSTVSTPVTAKKKLRGGHSTGYILYASEAHPRVRAENPELPFGEISKIIGEEWRSQTDEKKKEYEEKARQLTKEAEAEGRLIPKKKKKKKDADANVTPVATPPANMPPQPMYANPPGQPVNHQYMQRPPYQPGMPMPQQPPNQKPGYPPVQQVPPPQMQYAPPPPEEPQRKLFVAPPPKVQRVLHSEAYLRYIEGLEKGNPTLSGWEKKMNIQNAEAKAKEKNLELPSSWLKNGKGNHGSVADALWSLRNLMLKDALAIKSTL